ncbi:hypothetical protein N7481_008395 [Penicillium waksmanii]|uniref:uncharacterized protein n=1 Tax=Penicillium waksmanii TaxID=69791 RepID=UPI0025477E11|nr:uncharacterized protein N7481_008395 [Penicillium waksmanii]KAJ5981097.1 hypothetical protein N7481_008395 [Penicillium waksmanii]
MQSAVGNLTPSGLSYRKHVKGHIVVFPNKVEDLVATSVQISSMTLRRAIEGNILTCSYSRSENGEERLSIVLSGRVIQRLRINDVAAQDGSIIFNLCVGAAMA